MAHFKTCENLRTSPLNKRLHLDIKLDKKICIDDNVPYKIRAENLNIDLSINV